MNSIGTVLFSLAIKASVLLAVAFSVNFALRRAPASSRRLVWILAGVCLLLLPLLSMIESPIGIGRVWSQPAAWVSSTVSSPEVVVAGPALSQSTPKRAPIPWIPIVWGAGAMAVLLRLAAGMTRISWLARAAKRIQPPEAAAELARRIGITRVTFAESDRIAMPITWGVLRPLILLPRSRSEWPTERMRLVLAHELIHVQQRDCLLQLLLQFVCCVYWFHPLMWLGAAQFRKERERACDDGVLNLGVTGPDYAGHLLELVRSLKAGAHPSLAVAMAHQSNLEVRLVALLDANVNRKQLSRTSTVVATLVAVCLMLPMASVRGQSTGARGTLWGIVTDPSGAVIPNVTVQANNLDAHTMETTTANAAGEFTLKAIPTGHYTVEAMVPGFKVFRRDDVVLNSNDTQRLDVHMDLGGVNERLQVIGKKPTSQQVVPAGVPQRIRVGGNVVAAKLVAKVDPIYPEYTEAQGIQGTVLLRAIISKEGNVLSLSVINTADPDLSRAAMTAVQQWHYQPTLFNGQPVEVVTTITVDFKLKP
jgi:TonB family protein